MKKSWRIAIFCLLFVLVTIAILWKYDVFVFDRAEIVNSEQVVWNGKEYSPVSGEYTEGKTIAKRKDGNWEINSVEEDPSRIFIVARSFLDQYLMVADDYIIPTAGKLTVAAWNGDYITDVAFLEAVSKIEAERTTSFTYETEGIYQLTDDQKMRELYFAYEGCPVATNFKGYMGKVNGKWVITTDISQDTRNPDGSPKAYEVGCYVIPGEYAEIIDDYLD